MEAIADTADFDRLDFLDAILATMPEAVAIIRLDHQLTELNRAGLALLGAERLDDIPDNTPLSLIDRKHIPRFKAHFDRALSDKPSNLSQPIVIDVHALDGERRSVECRMAPLKDTDGSTAGVIITARNVSDRELNLRTLTEYASLLSAILDTVPDPMVVIDESGIITSFSATAETLFGHSEKDVIGHNVKMLMPEPHRSAHDGYMRRYLETGEKRIIGKGRLVDGEKKDGSIFPIELTVGEARTGDHRAFTGFVRDQTEKFQAEIQLHHLQAELVHTSRLSAVGTLASALAHELNQPLTAIANYMAASRDMVDDFNSETARLLHEALDETGKEALRAGQIIRRLRDFVAKGEMNMQILSLGKLINDATTLGLLGAREKGVTWSIEIEPGTDDVLADRVQIQQVMVNLMRNAIEAMEGVSFKQIAIRAHVLDNEYVEVSVTDSGLGVPDDLVSQLFLPFITTKAQGMGLGLSICRTIVEAHGGHLSAAPNPSGGAIFVFTLPRALRNSGNDG